MKVLLASDQQIVINSGETQQVIVDQSQMNFPNTYIKQENEIVEYQQAEIPHASGQQTQQVFYTTGNTIKSQTVEVRINVVFNLHLLRVLCVSATTTNNTTPTSATCKSHNPRSTCDA